MTEILFDMKVLSLEIATMERRLRERKERLKEMENKIGNYNR